MDYVQSQEGIHVKTRSVIHARIRNKAGQLTAFYSDDRFISVRAGFRRALPSVIDIDHQRCRILHQSQEKSCTRCRYICHGIDDTGVCEAFSSDQNIITIRSPKNVLCNYYMCDIDMYGHPSILVNKHTNGNSLTMLGATTLRINFSVHNTRK